MSERWQVRHDGTDRRTPWVVRDTEDRGGTPVAAFATEAEARAHAERLAQGPFDWDEQEAWQEPDPWDDPAEADGGEASGAD